MKHGKPSQVISMKNRVTRTGRFLGGYVPAPVVNGIQEWVQSSPERNISTFLREASREKLRRDGVAFTESPR